MLLPLLLAAVLGQQSGQAPEVPRELVEAHRLYARDAEAIQAKNKGRPKDCKSGCVEAQEMCQMMCKNNRLKDCGKMCAPALDECMKSKCGGKKKAPKSK